MKHPHHSLTLWVMIPAPFRGSYRQALHWLEGRQHPSQKIADTAKAVPSTGAKCSLTASFSPCISPRSEQQGEGRDLGCEWETETRGSVCSLITQLLKSKAPAHSGITRAQVLSKEPWLRLLESVTLSPHTSVHFTCSCLPEAQPVTGQKSGIRPSDVNLVPADCASG